MAAVSRGEIWKKQFGRARIPLSALTCVHIIQSISRTSLLFPAGGVIGRTADSGAAERLSPGQPFGRQRSTTSAVVPSPLTVAVLITVRVTRSVNVETKM